MYWRFGVWNAVENAKARSFGVLNCVSKVETPSEAPFTAAVDHYSVCFPRVAPTADHGGKEARVVPHVLAALANAEALDHILQVELHLPGSHARRGRQEI